MLQVQAIGNVGRKPELSYTPNGVAVAKFSLAVNPTDKKPVDNQGNKVDNTVWLNCVVWRALAETINTYVDTGSKLFVQGVFIPRPYVGRDGKNYVSYDLTVEKFNFLSKSNKSDASTPDENTSDVLGELDDHPF